MIIKKQIDYDDIITISQEYDISIQESIDSICEENTINDPVISVYDYDLILNPDIVNEFVGFNVKINEIEDSDPVFEFISETLYEYGETDDAFDYI